ncbi:MAG: 2-C-methyl-D-erythritol 4-phosphate cytidylyltransferase [Lysobacterales bacterium]
MIHNESERAAGIVNGPQVHALIPAAGRSVRFGGTMLKQYTHLMGQTVMAHSIAAVRKHPAVKRVTVALAPDDGIYDDLIRPSYPDVATVKGGDSRAQTVMNGLTFIRDIDPACEWVLVHDAARPCLSGSSLDDLLRCGLASESGAILAVPVSDTLKLADENGFIASTVERTRYWTAQTPQLFRIDPLFTNLESNLAFGLTPTDEAAAMESAGVHPLLVRGSTSNIKITGSEDLALAEFILRKMMVTE